MKLSGVLDVWGEGQLLAFSGIDGKTDFENGLVLRTSRGSYGMDIKLPGTGKINFGGKPSGILLAGDFFILNGGKIKGAYIDAYHLLIQGNCIVEHNDQNTVSISESDKTLIGSKKFFKPSLINKDIDSVVASRSKWLAGIKIPKKVTPRTRKTLFKAFSQMKTQVYSPEGRIRHYWTTPDRWPHRQMWLWDSVYHAIGLRHLDMDLARDAILALFDTQKKDGMISHMMKPSSSSEVTQPPIIAIGLRLLDEKSSEKKTIRKLYPKLKKYIEWDLANRDSDGAGLCEWFIEGSVNCRCGESGLDNSSRFDCAQKLDATDFNSYLALECEIMAEFAKISGHHRDIEYWKKLHRKICGLINERLWSEKKGFYFDFNLKEKNLSEIYAVSGFLPLICGAPSKKQAEKLVEHLNNPKTFGTPFRVPSIARCNQEHYSKDMWRGPTWIATNWLIIRGLERYGFMAEARKLKKETLCELEKQYMKHGTFFEFYDDRKQVDPPELLRKGKNAPGESPYHQVIFDYGWSATLYVDLVLR